MELILQDILQNSLSISEDKFDDAETKMIEDELKRLGYV